MGAIVGKERNWHWLGATLTALLMTLAVPVLAAVLSPEDTIAAIEAEAAAAAAWMDSRTTAYEAFLSDDPSAAEANAERDRAILEMYSKAFQTHVTVSGLMAQHPADPDVVAAGQEAISAAYEAAAEESQTARELYDEFEALAAVSTTTTTLLADLPPLPTTPTTLPGLPTTSTTNPEDTTTTTGGPATPSPASTTITTEPGAASGPTSTTLPAPSGSGAATQTVDGSEEGFGNLSTSELAIRLIGDQVPVGLERANLEDGGDGDQGLGFTVIRGLIRLSLPAAITAPLVDLALLLRAVVAAFLSGMATLAWPAGTLSGSLFLYGIWRRVKRI